MRRPADPFAALLGPGRRPGLPDAVRERRYGPHSAAVNVRIQDVRDRGARRPGPLQPGAAAAWERAVEVAKPLGRWAHANRAHLDVMRALPGANVALRIQAMHAVTAVCLADPLDDADHAALTASGEHAAGPA